MTASWYAEPMNQQEQVDQKHQHQHLSHSHNRQHQSKPHKMEPMDCHSNDYFPQYKPTGWAVGNEDNESNNEKFIF